jgi:acyl carrier protein
MIHNNEEELTRSVVEIVREVTRSNEVNEDSSTETLSEWDSLAYMSILSEIEVDYDVEITEDNIGSFDSISSIVQIIQKNNA